MDKEFEKKIEEELKDFSDEEIEFAKRFLGNAVKAISRPMDYKSIKNKSIKNK